MVGGVTAVALGILGATTLRGGFAAVVLFPFGALARFAGLAAILPTLFLAARVFLDGIFFAPAFLDLAFFALLAAFAFFAIAKPRAVVAVVISIGGA